MSKPTKNKTPFKKKRVTQDRPDPSFKEYIGQLAVKNGLELLNVEIPQLTSADLILGVPDNADVSATMFHFFAKINVVEFKSENDRFGERELAFNLARMHLLFAKNEELHYSQLLSVFICAHYPDKVIEHLAEEGLSVTKEAEWLLRCRYGAINLAIVVCRLLPLEERYYYWLMFAPVQSTKWREFVTILVEQNKLEVLKVMARLKPKEIGVMVKKVSQIMDISEEKQIEIAQGLDEFYRWLLKITENNPELNNKIRTEHEEWILERVAPAKLLARVTPEERLAGLKPEERLAGLKPEERLAGLKPEELEVLAKMLAERKKSENN